MILNVCFFIALFTWQANSCDWLIGASCCRNTYKCYAVSQEDSGTYRVEVELDDSQDEKR